MKLHNRSVGTDYKPYIIAELSGNHSHSLSLALKMVEAAALCGADCIKLQTYTPDTITIDHNSSEFMTESGGLWEGQTLYELYKKAYTPWEWHEQIFQKAAESGIACFSTPFDLTSVDFLESLNTPFYKISSFENIDTPLLIKVASTGKPVIMSTGMASAEELEYSVNTLRQNGCRDLILLKCTSSYPADPSDSNIATIPNLKKRYSCEAGISDHTRGIGVAIASVALGGCVIEKHFTLNRNEGGIDAAFSLEPDELAALVSESEKAWKAVGKIYYGTSETEKISVKYRKSLYIVSDIKKGDILTTENMRSIRPGYGLEPRHYYEMLGKKVIQDIKRGTALKREMVE